MPRQPRPIPLEAAELALSEITKTDTGCWESNYLIRSNGYATLSYEGIQYLAHRASWTAVNGQIPEGMVIDHKCFNRRCVNPDHLRVLTLRENTQRKNGRDFPEGECPWGHDNSFQKLYHWGKVPAQWGCSACIKEKNDNATKINTALRQLEIAFGVGDHHKSPLYRHAINQRNKRVLAVREARIGKRVPASTTGSDQ